VAPYPAVTVDSWSEAFGTPLLYLALPSVTLRRLVREVRRAQPSVIYLNSCLDRIFTLRILLARRCGLLGKTPVVLAPRGEFSPGALRLKKTRKAVFLRVCRTLGLYRGVTFHASSPYEARDIHSALGSGAGAITVASNIVMSPVEPLADPPPGAATGHSPVVLRVCFLARVSPMKNLEFALRVLANVRCRVDFSIYGPISDRDYWNMCQTQLSTLPAGISVQYRGDVPSSSVGDTLRGYDLFLLPTLGENFGHVIHEALSAGLPVLISDRTPWTGLEEAGVGWALPLSNPDAFVAVVEHVAAMSAHDRRTVAANARAYANRVKESNSAVTLTRQMFVDVATALQRP